MDEIEKATVRKRCCADSYRIFKCHDAAAESWKPTELSANSSKAGSVPASCILMQQKSRAPITSAFFFIASLLCWANSRRSWRSRVRRVSKRVCDDWRGVSLIHRCAASPWQNAAMLLIDTCAHAHRGHSDCLGASRCNNRPGGAKEIQHIFPLNAFFNQRDHQPQCDAEQWYCSAAHKPALQPGAFL